MQGNIQKAPTKIPIKTMPNQFEIMMLEEDLRMRFDAQISRLVDLYLLAVKYDIEHLQNNAIDSIQDGFHEYGTVFGPGMMVRIFKSTKKGSKLRELCIAANVIHIDRGCEQLREELMKVALLTDDFLPEMLKWISRNFVMFGRRQSEGFDVRKPTQGFSCKLHLKVTIMMQQLTKSDSAQSEEALPMPLPQARRSWRCTQRPQEVCSSIYEVRSFGGRWRRF